MKPQVVAAVTAGLCLAVLSATTAQADVFNGRIAFSSFRVDPQHRTGDIFTMNPDGTDLRQLTTNPEDDAQADWAPDGRDIAYRIRKPGFTTNFEVARMTAAGENSQRLTFTPDREAASQPAWFPDHSAILFRRSGGGASGGPIVASVWRMGPLGERPELRYDPAGSQWYPSLSPDMTTVLFATTMSPRGDGDRAIQTMNADGTGLRTLFDVVGAFDSAPAWSPDGTKIAFQSTANVNGGNPHGDSEIWVMNADGTNPTQLTDNTLHDEGPAWSPDGTMLAYSSGVDNDHVDINVMTAAGVHLRTLTDFEGRDESPDWQTIPAPATDRRCGDLGDTGPGVYDVRAAGEELSCRKARKLATRWWRSDGAGHPRGRIQGFDVDVSDFGGTLRVVLTHHGRRGDDEDRRGDDHGDHGDDDGEQRLVAFLAQR